MLEWTIISICSRAQLCSFSRACTLYSTLIEHIVLYCTVCAVMWLVVVIIIVVVVAVVCCLVFFIAIVDDYYRRHLWSCSRSPRIKIYINFSLVYLSPRSFRYCRHLFSEATAASCAVVVVVFFFLFQFICFSQTKWLFASKFIVSNSRNLFAVNSGVFLFIHHLCVCVCLLTWWFSTLFVLVRRLYACFLLRRCALRANYLHN